MNLLDCITNLQDVVVTGKVVVVRTDINVPIIDEEIIDTSRIRSLLPTINYLRSNGAKILLISHLGRPKGEKSEYTLKQLIPICNAIFNSNIRFIEDITTQAISNAINSMNIGDIALLENLRFYEEEYDNNIDFANIISSNANIYVNDAFACSHRQHSSIEAITHLVRSVAGFGLQKEIKNLGIITNSNNSCLPITAILGGSKISTKLTLLTHLAKKCNTICLGGGIANAILSYQGYNIGKSITEQNMNAEIKSFIHLAEESKCKIILPTDATVIQENGSHNSKSMEGISHNDNIVDIGEDSVRNINNAIQQCKTVLINGPLGIYERKPFDTSTNAVINLIANATKRNRIKSIAGGGDILACIAGTKCSNKFTFLSMGGGAFLEFISGIELPGIKALMESKKNWKGSKF